MHLRDSGEQRRRGGREEGRKGGREEGRKGGREEGRKGGREEGRKGGREEGRKGGRKRKIRRKEAKEQNERPKSGGQENRSVNGKGQRGNRIGRGREDEPRKQRTPAVLPAGERKEREEEKVFNYFGNRTDDLRPAFADIYSKTPVSWDTAEVS
ncbi:hypothetical protein [Bifidobacterium leontopitheci]|uniref:hypothetical protein n=1 Tax=Bifidobacterium leontopitheci TaxID=2650774 RepID=UPI00186B378B|nr:hypothetical protein [Bifidobacterium leontopitheci]